MSNKPLVHKDFVKSTKKPLYNTCTKTIDGHIPWSQGKKVLSKYFHPLGTIPRGKRVFVLIGLILHFLFDTPRILTSTKKSKVLD